VEVETDEEEGCSVGVQISEQSAVVYVSADVGNGGEGCINT